ncbi:MAG: stage III sporulation AC/AD family protein [Ruminococcus sp.]|nr:stage III sporulation AC/AD family protein [Ruminococcus sp.]
MVENCFTVSVFCICAAVLAVLLKRYCMEQSLLVALAACIGILGGFLYFLKPMISDIREIFASAGISENYISLIFKATAVCFITEISCEICRDSGENSIASAAEIWGRGAITFMSMPVLKMLVEKINEII